MVERTRRFLDYLAALARELTSSPERDIRSLPDARPVWPAQVPGHHGVVLGPADDRPAWLTVHKVPEPLRPDLPPSLVDAVDTGSLDDVLDLERPGAGPRQRTPEPVSANDDPGVAEARAHWRDRQRALDSWVTAAWRPWALLAAPARAARRLYAELFGLHLVLQSNQATHELVWGHSLLSWEVAGQRVLAPMLTTRMTVEIDEDDGSLRLLPERVCELELDALEGLGLPLIEELSGLRERLRLAPPDPWLPDGLAEVDRQIVAPLGLDARIGGALRGAVPTPAPTAVLTPTWVVYVRRRPVRHERFYSELADVLDETRFLPEGIAAVVSDDVSIERSLATLAGDDVAAGEAERASWRTVGEQLLMPLASNEDQERIVRQLARARGVTVQGPPGTGKTHTIANLVSHLVAHGKRVLVTAQNEQALAVLQEKIPAELRDLSVAVLGSSPEAMDQLRASAQAMTDLVAGLDEEREGRHIAELQARVEQQRLDIRGTELAMVEALRTEEREFALPSGPHKAPEVAVWLAENHGELGVLPDRVPPAAPLPYTDAECAELHRLATTLAPDDVSALRAARPPTTDLPVGAVLADQCDRQDRLRQNVADLEQEGLDLDGVDRLDEHRLAELTTLAQASGERLARLETPWLLGVREAVRRSPALHAYWAEQTEALAQRAGTLVTLQRQTVGWAVSVPAGDHREQLDLLDELAGRFGEGKGLPRFGSRGLKDLHEAVTVNDLPLRTTAEIEVVRAQIRLGVEARGLQIHLGQLAQQAGLPAPAPDAGFVAGVELLVQHLRDALAWETADRARVVTALRTAVTTLPDTPDADALRRVATLLDGATARRQEREIGGYLDTWAGYLDTGRDRPGASALWGRLRGALAARRWDLWDDAVAEGARLDALAPSVARRDELVERLRPLAPAWAERLAAGGPDAAAPEPAGWRAAWHWARADAWLADLHAQAHVETLQRRADVLREQLTDTVLDLARRSAAVGLKHNLRDDQRRALSAWLSALGKLGKGTGKYAPHWAREAREQLPVAMGAVPIWIMPIHRVIENFDPRRSALFDVVVVDESSQCDLLSVGVLALGRKSVVVGDDKQTSPSAVGIDRSAVIQLQDIYLSDVPQKALLTVDESLYGIAERAFPNVVMLREHFRSVPEIIEFSNRYYDHRILPLREQTREDIGAVLRAVPVPDGACTSTSGTRGNRVNPREAAALADQVVACAHDPAYRGATFGVVSLQSGNQSRVIEQLLLERLGLEEFQRRRLRVGTAAAFQGDERDVVFVSVVADDNSYAATRGADKQRINVAASRARDQLWVFHTVDPATLHADDQRKALVEYVRDAGRRGGEPTDLVERCESGFERDVLARLLDRGYRVAVQHKVGSYRIDLVVHGERDRVAVECDGDRFHGPEQWDDELRRQRVLERLGWKFWRVLASAFYRDPDAALEPLWRRLDQLDVRPTPPSGR